MLVVVNIGQVVVNIGQYLQQLKNAGCRKYWSVFTTT